MLENRNNDAQLIKELKSAISKNLDTKYLRITPLALGIIEIYLDGEHTYHVFPILNKYLEGKLCIADYAGRKARQITDFNFNDSSYPRFDLSYDEIAEEVVYYLIDNGIPQI